MRYEKEFIEKLNQVKENVKNNPELLDKFFETYQLTVNELSILKLEHDLLQQAILTGLSNEFGIVVNRGFKSFLVYKYDSEVHIDLLPELYNDLQSNGIIKLSNLPEFNVTKH